MPPLQRDLEPYRGFIERLYTDGANYDNIAHALSREHDITVSAKTIQRRIKDWDVPGQRTAIEPDETLLAFIECLLRDGHRPKRCVEILNSNGVSMTQRQFRTIRTDFLGIRLRVDSQQHREDQAREIARHIEELEPQGMIQKYGREFLYTHLRQRGLFSSRWAPCSISRATV